MALGGTLQLQQSLRRVDDHSSRVEVDLLNDLFRHRDQIFFRFALDDVEIAAGRGGDARDLSEEFAAGGENFEADDLIVVILVVLQWREIGFGDGDNPADPFLRLVDFLDAGEANEQLLLVRLDRLQSMRRARAVLFEKNFLRGKKGGAVGIVRV